MAVVVLNFTAASGSGNPRRRSFSWRKFFLSIPLIGEKPVVLMIPDYPRLSWWVFVGSVSRNPAKTEEWIGGDGEHDTTRIDFQSF